jgi:hypothetical protein
MRTSHLLDGEATPGTASDFMRFSNMMKTVTTTNMTAEDEFALYEKENEWHPTALDLAIQNLEEYLQKCRRGLKPSQF